MSALAVVFRRAAERELLEAYAWYEEKRRGLGEEFRTCVEAAVEQIRREPLAQAVVHSDIRRLFTRRFPYGVFYVVEPERIVVLAVFHARRDPRIWQHRS